MNNELLLLSNNDIPFVEAQLTIHQPTLNEISLIGEKNFFTGCQFLTFSKERLDEKDRIGLEDKSDFDIFMSVMCSSEKVDFKDSVMSLLTLIFPNYSIKFINNEILLAGNDTITRINNDNYNIFKDIIVSMFLLNESDGSIVGYNPADGRAKKIADKLNKYKDKIAQMKGDEKSKIAVFSRLVSILSVGLQKDKNDLMNYTVFQIKDEFSRYQSKQSFDMYVQAKMAGAKDLEEVDNWMEDIHP
jgi:hypothetical protein